MGGLCCGCTVRSLTFMGLRAATRRIGFCIPHTIKNGFISLFFVHVSCYVSYFSLCASLFLFSVLTEFLVSFTPSFSVHYLIPGLNRRDTRLLCGGAACLSLIILMCLYTGSVLSGQGDIFWLTYNPVLFYTYSRHMPHSLKGFNAGLFRISSLCMSGKEASGR